MCAMCDPTLSVTYGITMFLKLRVTEIAFLYLNHILTIMIAWWIVRAKLGFSGPINASIMCQWLMRIL